VSFVIDGSDWNFNGIGPADTVRHIEQILEFVRVCEARDETVWIGDDFQTRPMYGTDGLWQLAGNAPFNGDLVQELAAWLGRANYYTESGQWPQGADEFAISVDGAPPTDNVDVAWVHHSVREGRAMACISRHLSGLLPTQTVFGVVDVHFVADEEGRVAFWRDAIKIEGDNGASLVRFAPHAYPNIYFVPGVLADVDRLGGGYLALRARVQAAFEALDEHGHWIFTEAPPAVSPAEPRVGRAPPPTNQIIEKRFQNVGFDAAPEKPNVRQDRECRAARETELGKVTLYCEWHIKLEPHRNRIHVHGPVKESGELVIVGMIDEHLPLP
jgi:hypothetical protein